ncbi:MAG: O-antigen ligase family protein, partial [Promethearchaeota archaeon]
MFNDILPKTKFGSGIPDIDSFRAISYLLFLGSIVHWSIMKDIKILNRWIMTIAIFYIIVFASVAWSNFNYNAAILRQLLDTTFIPFFIAILAINLFQNVKNVRIYLKHIVVAAFILSVISIIQMIFALTKGDEFRSTGMFANPNTLAIMLVLAIPCLLYAIENNLTSEIFGWIATISIIAGIVCSVSRKGIITMILCFCLYYLLKKRYKIFFCALLAFLSIGIALSDFEIVGNRFERSTISQTFENKWDMTAAGLKMFFKSPIYGLGFEGYKDNYSDYFPWKSKTRYDAHNIFVTTLANYGIIGFVPFFLIFFIPLVAASRILLYKVKNIDKNDSNIAIFCLTTVIPFIINGWFAGGLFYSSITI